MLRYKIQWDGNSDSFTQFMMSNEAYLIHSGQNCIPEKCFREAYIKGGKHYHHFLKQYKLFHAQLKKCYAASVRVFASCM
jgi:hypothetical protein